MNQHKIKFRGKRIDTGKWIYGDLFHDHEQKDVCIALWESVCTEQDTQFYELKMNFISVDPETVGQFIGKIKTDQDIYINDLIQHGETVRVVSYRNGNTCLDRQNMKDTILLSYSSNAKKVGNIFDNPELLTE